VETFIYYYNYIVINFFYLNTSASSCDMGIPTRITTQIMRGGGVFFLPFQLSSLVCEVVPENRPMIF